MQQFNSMVAGIDRAVLIKVTAIGLLIYAVLNACGGLFAAIGGGLLATFGAGTAAVVGQTGVDTLDAEMQAALAQAAPLGGLLIVLAIIWLISVPLFAAASYGLFQRKAWARNLTIVSLGLVVLSEILTLGGVLDIIWLVLAVFLLYMYLTDEGIKRELAR